MAPPPKSGQESGRQWCFARKAELPCRASAAELYRPPKLLCCYARRRLFLLIDCVDSLLASFSAKPWCCWWRSRPPVWIAWRQSVAAGVQSRLQKALGLLLFAGCNAELSLPKAIVLTEVAALGQDELSSLRSQGCSGSARRAGIQQGRNVAVVQQLPFAIFGERIFDSACARNESDWCCRAAPGWRDSGQTSCRTS